MTFLNELWNKLKTAPHEDPTGLKSSSKKAESRSLLAKELTEHPSPSNHLQNAEAVINALDHHQVEVHQSELIKKNLAALKTLMDAPKEEAPEVRYTKIKQLLNPPVQHETMRHERMQPNIHCPDCSSGNIKRLVQLAGTSPLKHRYRCMDCGLVFNDDTGTPLEHDVPPLNIWMQCWYLMGCTESLSYIATKLNIELTTVEWMVEQLRRIFNAQRPLTRFIDYDEWSKQSVNLRNQLKEDLLRQYEQLSADIATTPKDTAEFRRQQNLRRDLNITPEPPSGGGKKKI